MDTLFCKSVTVVTCRGQHNCLHCQPCSVPVKFTIHYATAPAVNGVVQPTNEYMAPSNPAKAWSAHKPTRTASRPVPWSSFGWRRSVTMSYWTHQIKVSIAVAPSMVARNHCSAGNPITFKLGLLTLFLFMLAENAEWRNPGADGCR